MRQRVAPGHSAADVARRPVPRPLVGQWDEFDGAVLDTAVRRWLGVRVTLNKDDEARRSNMGTPRPGRATLWRHCGSGDALSEPLLRAGLLTRSRPAMTSASAGGNSLVDASTMVDKMRKCSSVS